jgi:hypothetical protein
MRNVFTKCTDLRHVVHIHYSICLLMWFKMVEELISPNVSELWCCFCVFRVFLFVCCHIGLYCLMEIFLNYLSFCVFLLMYMLIYMYIASCLLCIASHFWCVCLLLSCTNLMTIGVRLLSTVCTCCVKYMYLYPLLLNLWYWFVFGESVSLCSGNLLTVCAVIWLCWIFVLYFVIFDCHI